MNEYAPVFNPADLPFYKKSSVYRLFIPAFPILLEL